MVLQQYFVLKPQKINAVVYNKYDFSQPEFSLLWNIFCNDMS